jgi:hypothetical protein
MTVKKQFNLVVGVSKDLTNAPMPRPLPLSEPQVIQNQSLPNVSDLMRTMPNHVARSSLFAPVARGRRKVHVTTPLVLVSRNDAEITFMGKQLDEAQSDVWMQAIHEASKHNLGEHISINRAEFLRAIGRNTSGDSYKWLHQAFEDLSFGRIKIEIKKDGKTKYSIGKIEWLHLLKLESYDPATEVYSFSVDPRWSVLYANREFALVDWDKRLALGRSQDMAKAMQRLLAASSDERQSFALDWLKKKLEYESPMRKFCEAITKAMEELHRVEIVSKWEISKNSKGKDQLIVWRV